MSHPFICNSGSMRFALGLAAHLFTAAAFGAPSAPYVPTADDQIVQRLPLTWGAKSRTPAATSAPAALSTVAAQQPVATPTTERRLFAALNQEPNNLPLALATAQEALQRARRTGDPRAVGQAQAALAPWWAQASPPDAVRLLRATILQSQHHFAQALQDLDVLIARPARGTPLNWLQQARLTRAAVLQVQARLDEAARDCDALTTATPGNPLSAVATLAAACQAELRSLRGEPQRGARELARLAQTEQGAGPQQAWLSLLRAELAQRMGDATATERHFKTAVAEGDPYAQAAYADALLEAGQPARALRAVQWVESGEAGRAQRPNPTPNPPNAADAALLRQAIALKRLQHPSAVATAQALRERLQEARTRGATLHLREEARFALDIDDQPARAWPLARANWQTQKEPADALLYVRAAVAAGEIEAAEQLTQQLQSQGWIDLRLQRAMATAKVVQVAQKGLP